jgi:hypothetical protein
MEVPGEGLGLESVDAPPLAREQVLRSLRVLRTHGREALLRQFGFDKAERSAVGGGVVLFAPDVVVNLGLAAVRGPGPRPGRLGGVTEPDARARLERLGFEVVSPQPLPLAGDLARASYVERPAEERLEAARAGLPADAMLLVRTEPDRLPDYALSPGDLAGVGPGDLPLEALRGRMTVPAWAWPEHDVFDLGRVLRAEPQTRLFVVADMGSARVLGVILAEAVLHALEDWRRLHAFVAASGLPSAVFAADLPAAEVGYACGGPPAHVCRAAEVTREGGGPHCVAHGRAAPAMAGGVG